METFNNLGEERVEQEEDSLKGELENYLIVGAQVLTGCLGPGATLVVTEFYRFQVSGSGCLRNSFHLMTLYSRKGETLWLGIYSRPRIVIHEELFIPSFSTFFQEEVFEHVASIVISLHPFNLISPPILLIHPSCEICTIYRFLFFFFSSLSLSTLLHRV